MTVSLLKIIIFTFSMCWTVGTTFSCPQQINDENHLSSLDLQCFRKHYDSSKHDGHKLSQILNQKISNYKRLLQDIKMNGVDHMQTHPVIKWAQSQSQIFLNLRLSHRHDSPTCSDIRYQKMSTDVQNRSGDYEIKHQVNTNQSINSWFAFESQCLFTHQKLLFSLNITFNSTLQKLTVRKEGFGRYTLIGQKKVNSIWINPFTGSKDAGIWSELRNKYSSDMDKYFQLMESNKPQKQKTKRKFRNKTSQKSLQPTVQL